MVAVARQRLKGFPRGEAVKIGSSEPILTDEECGRKSWITALFQTYSGLTCRLTLIRLQNSQSFGYFESTFPQGKALVR